MENCKAFIDFLKTAVSPFHAQKGLCGMLEKAGFAYQNETKPFAIVPGGKYYTTRNQSAVIAFTVPEKVFESVQIVSSHSDSPCFKLKPKTEEKALDVYLKLNVEKYGGLILSTWLDRPLSIAGRVFVKDERGIHSVLVDLARDAVLIPNMPIHFCRDMNDGFAYNAQVDMLPLYGTKDDAGALVKELAEKAGVSEDSIVSFDLYLYNRMSASVWGVSDAFFSAQRIDDLECAYTSIQALCASDVTDTLNICAVFDNEEVGSLSRQGADSTFLADVITRVGSALSMTDEAIRAAMASGFMVSADNAHALHPNHPEKYDADNRVYMNGGVVIKHAASQKYTTDGASDAVFSEICRRAGVPVQHFTNRSDIAGGSTLGSIANAHVSLNTVDIGLAQLAMHSSYETAGTKDVTYMIDALKAFYCASIRMTDDGCFTIQ